MVDGQTPPTDERRLDGNTISSSCYPNGSGELKIIFSHSLGTVTKMHIPVTSYGG